MCPHIPSTPNYKSTEVAEVPSHVTIRRFTQIVLLQVGKCCSDKIEDLANYRSAQLQVPMPKLLTSKPDQEYNCRNRYKSARASFIMLP